MNEKKHMWMNEGEKQKMKEGRKRRKEPTKEGRSVGRIWAAGDRDVCVCVGKEGSGEGYEEGGLAI